ncbi:MAG: mannitol-1-phosphate 5-dehydrogenase [Epulopiscium sp. Nele67-Bin005]|nr:MAG: mannitol-1-phosphate 5-dehydrogenase [Epulopiscium sp. Nele67-Bin005]
MKSAIQFGGGNIGRGFIGALLSNAGYHVVFADVNEAVINALNTDNKYTVFVYDEVKSEEEIKNVSGVISTSPEMIDELAKPEVELITTAVGLLVLPRIAPSIAKGITKRMEAGIKTIVNVIACENAINGSSALKEHVYENLSDEAKAYADEFFGFPNCAVDRIVPPVTTENVADVIVESYYEWDVQKDGFKGEIPQIEGMTLVDNLSAYLERKLFTLNCGHAVTAYLGVQKGYDTVEQSINDPEILKVVKGAMMESGNALIKKYSFDETAHHAYIDKIINRFKNPHLNDSVTRVGREPLRKLSSTDRLVKPLTTANEFGFAVDNLVTGIASALHYFDETDAQSAELKKHLEENGVKGAFTKVSGVTDNTLVEKVEAAYNAQ